jgi:REP element-mobilizing transposase RayT
MIIPMLYESTNLVPVHRLHYAWMGWPTEGTLLPPLSMALSGSGANADLTQAWATDGLTCVSDTWSPQQVQLVFRVAPGVAPVAFTQRVKGRLQYALRRNGTPVAFSRKVGMRALGANIGTTVQRYVREQLEHVDLADPRYAQRLAEASREDLAVDLAVPAQTDSGRYWYNLHLVLVSAGRYRVGPELHIGDWSATVRAAAAGNGCAVRALAVMPDHVHLALRGNITLSPVEIGVLFQNALAKIAGGRVWQDMFYIGTFGEYSLCVVAPERFPRRDCQT